MFFDSISNTLKQVVFALINFVLFFAEIPGHIVKLKIILLHKPVVFKDRLGYLYLQTREDPTGFNYRRRSISDSLSVVLFLRKKVSAGQLCVDIGAAYGAISVPLWHCVGKSGQVISVEADPTKISRIKANLLLNGFTTDYVLNVAISDKKEIRPFRFYPESPGWNTLGNPAFAKGYHSYTKQIQCIDLQSLLKRYNYQKIDLIKIDTEGAELKILRGMEKLLRKGLVTTVVFEVNPLMLPGMGSSPEQLLQFWDNLPYDLHKIGSHGELLPLTLPWKKKEVGDCVAIYSSKLARQS